MTETKDLTQSLLVQEVTAKRFHQILTLLNIPIIAISKTRVKDIREILSPYITTTYIYTGLPE
jgi:hypothetical protein